MTTTKRPLRPWDAKSKSTKKTDKRGTWAFHSVDGWYIATSPEHYRTHKCHIKETKSDRFSDTVQFQHKDITNPTVTPHDKLMHALADCAKAIKGIEIIDTSQDLRDIQRITQSLTDGDKDADIPQQPAIPRVQPAPRVDTHNMPTNMRIT